MDKLMSAIQKAEKCLNEAKRHLEVLDGQDSPEDLLQRAKALGEQFNALKSKLREKETTLVEALVILGSLAKVEDFFCPGIGHIKIRSNMVILDFGVRQERVPIDTLVEASHHFCPILIERIPKKLKFRLEYQKEHLVSAEELRRKVVEVIEPFRNQ